MAWEVRGRRRCGRAVTRRGGGGGDESENLACYLCNLHEGPNLTGIDPDVGAIAPLFDPRRETWNEHFAQRGCAWAARSAWRSSSLPE
jgi:hypothetical protein